MAIGALATIKDQENQIDRLDGSQNTQKRNGSTLNMDFNTQDSSKGVSNLSHSSRIRSRVFF